MTVELETDPQAAPKGAKSRSGTETRQRTERFNLRLLPDERRAAEALANERGYNSVQAWVLSEIQPALHQALERLSTDEHPEIAAAS